MLSVGRYMHIKIYVDITDPRKRRVLQVNESVRLLSTVQAVLP